MAGRSLPGGRMADGGWFGQEGGQGMFVRSVRSVPQLPKMMGPRVAVRGFCTIAPHGRPGCGHPENSQWDAAGHHLYLLGLRGFLTKAEKSGAWPPDKLALWQATRDFLTPVQLRTELGQWLLRSGEGIITCSAPLPTMVNSPLAHHGE